MENDLLKKLDLLRKSADQCETKPVKARQAKLKEFRKILVDHRDVIIDALKSDLGKSGFETLSAEMMPLLEILNFLIRKLPKLSRSRRLSVSPLNFPASGRLVPEPYGMVLVIATWNYPLLLSLEPLLGAYAAGNKVVLKLATRSEKTMNLVSHLVGKCFGEDEVVVIDGDVGLEDTLSYRYDYIFYTGSNSGGKLVLQKAAENFTPVTLEMGGKSPCIVDESADLHQAARRIAWGKFSNAGQTCVAPDNLLVAKKIMPDFIRELIDETRKMYGDEPFESRDFGKLADQRAYERMSKLAGNGCLLWGGEKSPETLQIAPTVIGNLKQDDPLMNEEIFGPVLPVRSFENEAELLKMLPRRPRPLALYYFGKNRRLEKILLRNTSSGAVVFNDVVTHFLNSGFPFGGVGESGMGSYHGKRTFETFCHYKPVMKRSARLDFSLRYPPYGKFRLKLLKLLTGGK